MLKRHEIEVLLKGGHSRAEVAPFDRGWAALNNPPLFARKTSWRLSSMATRVTPSEVPIVFGCCGSVSVSEDHQK